MRNLGNAVTLIGLTVGAATLAAVWIGFMIAIAIKVTRWVLFL